METSTDVEPLLRYIMYTCEGVIKSFKSVICRAPLNPAMFTKTPYVSKLHSK